VPTLSAHLADTRGHRELRVVGNHARPRLVVRRRSGGLRIGVRAGRPSASLISRRGVDVAHNSSERSTIHADHPRRKLGDSS